MRRIQLYLEDSMDDQLVEEARRRGKSKGALIREAVAVTYPPPAADDVDGLAALDGWLDIGPIDDIDAVIYGPSREVR